MNFPLDRPMQVAVVDDTQLLDVLPNLRNWDAPQRHLGFV